MCKLAVAIIENEKGRNEVFNIMTAQYADFCIEKDGIASYIEPRGEKPKVERSLTAYKDTYLSFLAHLPIKGIAVLHTRTGTSGAKDESNVHFFEHKGNYFAHNGFAESAKGDAQLSLYNEMSYCRGCATAKGGVCKKHKPAYHKTLHNDDDDYGFSHPRYADKYEGKCDSLLFLERLTIPVTRDTLTQDAQGVFSGFGFLATEGKRFLLVQKEVRVWHTQDFTIFFSYTPEREYTTTQTKNIYGVSVTVNTKKEKFIYPTHTAGYGIYEIKLPANSRKAKSVKTNVTTRKQNT